MTDAKDLPSANELMWPTLLAIRALGGSGRIDEITSEVIREQGFTEDQMAVRRSEGDRLSMIEYRLAWSRNRLKNAGAIENSARGVWSLTDAGRTVTSEELGSNFDAWKHKYRRDHRDRQQAQSQSTGQSGDSGVGESTTEWADELIEKLLNIEPSAFERLAQRLLREAGFRNVEVLGKSGDGGIDGVGVYQLSLVSFPIFFQCKRYKGLVGSGAVRDFRGAMSGRGEKGLLITTGSFSRDARSEASRDGAPPVELIDGESLCQLLKQYSLGVFTETRVVESVEVDAAFFDQF